MIEMLVGLNVTDDNEYSSYREGMTPILNKIGGNFGYDFKIAETLKSETEEKINRVFTISFPNNEAMDEFFNNPIYNEIKIKHFQNSVASTTIIAKYEKT